MENGACRYTKIIYHCFGGSHSSVMAASIHLGLLPLNRIPRPEELMALPVFDKTSDKDFGVLKWMGTDEKGRQVYILAKKSMGERMSHILLGLADLMGIKNELLVVNTMPYVNWMMMVGGFLSRRAGMPWLGRPLLMRGAQRAYFDLVALVQSIKLKLI